METENAEYKKACANFDHALATTYYGIVAFITGVGLMVLTLKGVGLWTR